MSQAFASRLEGSVAIVNFDRPPHNYVNPDILSELADILERMDRDESCRAIVLQASGKTFCAGADLSSAASGKSVLQNDQAREGESNPLYAQAVRLHATRKPIIVAVQGAAIGAGVGLALIGDFRLAATTAYFTTNFVKLGFHPGFGLTKSLPRLIGEQQAKLMLTTGRKIDAETARAIGLVDQVCPPETLHADALALAREIAANAPIAVQATLATLRGDRAGMIKQQSDHEHNEQQKHIKTQDFLEGVKASMERRAPNFTGR